MWGGEWESARLACCWWTIEGSDLKRQLAADAASERLSATCLGHALSRELFSLSLPLRGVLPRPRRPQWPGLHGCILEVMGSP
jgi:hypothetical protein